MANKRSMADDEICDFLAQEAEVGADFVLESDSELEDHLNEDDVQSDLEGEVFDHQNAEEENQASCEALPVLATVSVPLKTSAPIERYVHIIVPTQPVMRGKNMYCWSTSKGQTHGKTSSVNIIRAIRGPTRMCRNIFDPLLCFDLFVTDEILNEFVQWTNVEISLKRRDNTATATFRDTNPTEMRALIGILTLSAAMKDNHLSSEELFESTFLGTRYVAVMSRERFDFLIRSLRMDDKSLRPAVRQQDPFIPIRKVWELFITQCKLNYSPRAHVTIDGQLVEFRGRCPF